jgi:anti-sigma factor RsiW
VDPETLHRECRERLPWFVAGTLGDGEAAEVRRHLESCVACRAEFDDCRDLADRVAREAASAPVAHPARLTRLLARLEADDRDRRHLDEARRAPGRLRLWLRRTPRGARWVLAGQAAALAVLALLLGRSGGPEVAPPGDAFRTLSAAREAVPARRVRVVFAPETPEREIRALLLGLRAELVAGPSSLGAYTLALEPASAGEPGDAELVLLRADPRVRLAEPIGGDDATRR